MSGRRRLRRGGHVPTAPATPAAGQCDFCTGPPLGSWSRFEVGGGPDVPLHYLLACTGCARHVERRDWQPLLDEVLVAHERRLGRLSAPVREVFRSELGELYQQLEGALTGRVQSVRPAR